MPVTFDTHRLIQRLTQGQMTLEQAEAVSEALQQALEGSLGQLASKADVEHLEKRLTWMVGTNMALTLLVLGKVFIF